MIKAFVHLDRLFKEVNNTYITLTPEKENAIDPLAFAIVFYKFNFKLLANRLWVVLPKLF